MKRIFLSLLVLLPMAVWAQVHIGYIKYNEVLKQMPEYTAAQESLAKLKAQYDQEATRGEEEFQRKFSEFLQGQKDFPQNILVKRQAELQVLMENGVQFRQEAQELLTQAEQDLLAGVSATLNEAIRVVGKNNGFACILNIDANQCPFINPALGQDVTDLVLQKLGLKAEMKTQVEETTPVEETKETTPAEETEETTPDSEDEDDDEE